MIEKNKKVGSDIMAIINKKNIWGKENPKRKTRTCTRPTYE